MGAVLVEVNVMLRHRLVPDLCRSIFLFAF